MKQSRIMQRKTGRTEQNKIFQNTREQKGREEKKRGYRGGKQNRIAYDILKHFLENITEEKKIEEGEMTGEEIGTEHCKTFFRI